MTNKNLKLMISILLSLAILFSFTACSDNKNKTEDASSVQSVENQSDTQNGEKNTDNNSSEKKILIAYFTAAENSGVDAISSASYSTVNGVAVGRTRAVADMIANKTGGELFSIQTSVIYPTDGNAFIDFASDEQNENARPELTSHIVNFEEYDIIFIGYPTWWYDMPQVMYSFFDEYDFSGKTIIPFNVHNGSRFSGTIETIKELEPNANVITDGFTVNERDVADAKDDVEKWLSGLSY